MGIKWVEFLQITNFTHTSFSYMHISILYMFRAKMCSSSGESIVSVRHLAYATLCRWPCGMQVWMFHPYLHTRRSPTKCDICQMSYWYNWFSWWWAYRCSKHVEDRNKHTRKITVGQVGYLQELLSNLEHTVIKLRQLQPYNTMVPINSQTY